MIRSRLAWRLLGISALAVALLGVGAGGAQAEAGAKWYVGGIDAAALKAVVAGGFVAGGSLLTKISGTAVEIHCTFGKPVGISLEGEGKITTGGKFEASVCETKLGGKLSKICEPSTGGFPGVIETKKLKGEIVLHSGGVGLVKVEPESGTTVATLVFDEECSLPEEVPIIGVLFLRDFELTTYQESHFAEQGPLTALWAISKTIEHSVTLDGLSLFGLGGAHAGKSWRGEPG